MNHAESRPKYESAAYIIDTYLASTGASRTNISPDKIPWSLLRTLIAETYGGKIDNEADFAVLRQLVESTMTPHAYNDGHKLVEGGDSGGDLIVPEGTSMRAFRDWVDALPEREPPTYLGLPMNAEKLLLVGLGKGVMEDLRRVGEGIEDAEQGE